MSLSPGTAHLEIPRSVAENIEWREFVLKRCKESKRHREWVIEQVRHDILFYVNTFVWQYNSNAQLGQESGPFVTWGFQDRAFLTVLQCVEDRRDLVIEKSREMGASWLCLILMDWACIARGGRHFLCISRSEKAVDAPDPNALFPKIDYMHKALPEWLLPRERMTRQKLYYSYPSGSHITGEASTGRAGVGGRATAIFVDEFSQIHEDYEVLYRTADTSRCRIFNFTHVGLGTAAFDLCQRREMRKLQLHWSQHPEKNPGLYRFNDETKQIEVLDTQYRYAEDFEFTMEPAPAGGPYPLLRSPWYDAECIRRGNKRQVAMDLDIDPQGSASQFFDPLTINQLKATYAMPACWEGELAYDVVDGRVQVRGLVETPGGKLKLWKRPDLHGRLPRAPYGVGCDVSAGTGATPTCLSAADGRTGEKLVQYTNAHADAREFAAYVVALCLFLEDEDGHGAMLAWETPGPGVNLGKRVMELGYRRVYWREKENVFGHQKSNIPGWHNSQDSCRLLLEEYRYALTKRQFVNRCEDALEECKAFKYSDNGREIIHGAIANVDDPTGAGVNHGDHVIADALCWKMIKGFAETGGAKREAEGPPPNSMQGRRDRDRSRRLQESEW